MAEVIFVDSDFKVGKNDCKPRNPLDYCDQKVKWNENLKQLLSCIMILLRFRM